VLGHSTWEIPFGKLQLQLQPQTTHKANKLFTLHTVSTSRHSFKLTTRFLSNTNNTTIMKL